MFENVTITGYTQSENGIWLHFRDNMGRARHARFGTVYLMQDNGKFHLVEV